MQFFGWQTHLFSTHVVFAAAHLPQSRNIPQPSFVGPHSILRSSHDFGAHVGGCCVLEGATVPGTTQRFVAASHARSEGQGHVFCEKSTSSTPHAATTIAATERVIVVILPGLTLRVPHSRDFARSIWKYRRPTPDAAAAFAMSPLWSCNTRAT